MEYDNDRKIKPVFKTEIYFWIFIFLFYPIINFFGVFYRHLVMMPVLLLFAALVFPFYFVYGKLIVPWLAFPKRRLLFAITSVLYAAAILFFIEFFYSLVPTDDSSNSAFQQYRDYFNFSFPTICRESLWICLNLLLAGSIAYLKKHRDEADLLVDKEKEIVDLKLKYLRSQLNPHFLFNTLNSIYSLSMQKSDKTPDVVVKLADLLRYMIYDCNEQLISLEQEIAFINNYIELEKLRHKADIQFTVEGSAKDTMIEPLLFISFIENGFKHAFANSFQDPFIYITIKILDDRIVFNVINNTDLDFETQAKKMPGTGIRNSKSLLELAYPESYALDIIQTDKEERKNSSLRIANARKRLEELYPDSHALDVILSKSAYTVSLVIKKKAA